MAFFVFQNQETVEDPKNNPWQTLSSRDVYNNPWIGVTEHEVINPSGKPGIYGKVHYKNIAIGTIALDAAGSTYLVGQFRYVLGAYSWEIPEGGCPRGTDPLESAKRELREETGLTAGRWTLLHRLHLSNSVSDEEGLIFLAEDLHLGASSPEDTEADIRVKKLPLEEAIRMALDGRITDSMSIIALLRCQSSFQAKRK